MHPDKDFLSVVYAHGLSNTLYSLENSGKEELLGSLSPTN